MFRHRGKSRTFTHNIQLASLLSFVAGIVNVCGFFAVQKLTTNVTGHFAFFADEVIKKNYPLALVYLLYIISFLLGAFASNFMIEALSQKNARFVNLLPVSIEISIITSVALLNHTQLISNANIIACSLLFAMGLQNALVTSISNSIVRTTHLTGLFTDLGIELSQLFFYRRPDQLKRLHASVKLRLVIISCFFSGCIAGGYSYALFGILSLLLAVFCLIIGMVYDGIKLKIVLLRRKYL